MKGLGMLLLLVTGLMGGIVGRMRLQQRVAGLTEVKNRIHRLHERIRYTAAPMKELFAEFGVASSVSSIEEEREEWEGSVSRWGESVGLSDDDSKVLKGFAQGFGRFDVEGELRFCEEYQLVFSERLEHAKEALKTKGRVWLTLGTCAGLTVGLLLL